MSQTINIFICILIAATFVGCSESGGGSRSKANRNPKSKEEALSKLSPTHKQNFENWKKQIVKSCAAAEAFGLNQDHKSGEEGIDGSALIQNHAGSVVFSDDKNLAILTSYNSFSGTSTTKSEQTQETNGKAYTVSAETKREGSSCAVYLFGQKVYETYIVQNFIVGTQWGEGKAAQYASAAPQIKALGSSGFSEAYQQGVFGLITQALKPSKEAISLIAKSLSLTEEQANQFFKLSGYTSANTAVRIQNESSALWSNQEGNNLIASQDVLTKTFDGTQKILNLEVRLEIPEFNFSEIKNSGDSGNIKMDFNILLTPKNTSVSYSMESLDLLGFVPFDKDEATSCVKERAMAYIGSSQNPNEVTPSVSWMMSPCETLHREIKELSFQNGLIASLIPQIFVNITPSRNINYGGWDEALSRLALESLDKNKNIRSELDPNSKTRIVNTVANHLESLKHEMSRTKNMSGSQDTVFQMGLDWTFNGYNISVSRAEYILQSVDNSIVPFKVSSENLLRDLGSNTNSNEDQLDFAKNIQANHKSEALKALGIAQALSYTDFEREVFNQTIQKKISLEDFKNWSLKLESIKTKVNSYPNLGSAKGKIVSLSVKWLNSGEATIADLDPIYSAINNSIVPFEESTNELIRSLDSSLSSQKAALDFARALSPEYKQLAINIRDKSKTAEFESWGSDFFKSVLQKQPTLEQLRVWESMWTGVLGFTQREQNRTKNEFGSSNDWNRKKIIETAISESWSNSEFLNLEIIAEVARSKNTCENYVGYSSIANCGGMKLFSKQPKMFFDSAYGGRYTGLAKDFTVYMKQLAGFDWTNIRWNLVNTFFGTEPIWSKCDISIFNQNAANLKAQINAIAKEKDQFKKWELEDKIKVSIKNCQ